MRESPQVSQAWANSCQGGETWESWARGCVGPAAEHCSAFQGQDAGLLTLSWHLSDTLLPFSLAARVKTYSLLFPAPGFPRKTVPGTKQETRSRNETSPFPLYAPCYPHPGRLRTCRQGRSGGGNSPSLRLALPQLGDRENEGGRQGRFAAAMTMSAATSQGVSDSPSQDPSGTGADALPPSRAARRCRLTRSDPRPPQPRRPPPFVLLDHTGRGSWLWKLRVLSPRLRSGRGQGRSGGLMGRGANGRNTRAWEDPPPPETQPSSLLPLCCSNCSAKRLERNKSGNPPCPPRRETGER